MTELAAHGVGVEVPHGWEGRIVRRAAVHPAERSRAVVHLASFPMPEERGDFGVGVTELMRSGDVFVTLFEYGPESVGKPLFAAQGVPRLTTDLFTSAAAATNAAAAKSVASSSSPRTAGRSASTSWSPAASTCAPVIAQVNTMLDSAGALAV